MQYFNPPTRRWQSPKPPTPRQIAFLKQLYLSSCFSADEVAELDQWLVRATRREVSEKIDEAKARLRKHDAMQKAITPIATRLDSLTRRVAYQVDKHTGNSRKPSRASATLPILSKPCSPQTRRDRP